MFLYYLCSNFNKTLHLKYGSNCVKSTLFILKNQMLIGLKNYKDNYQESKKEVAIEINQELSLLNYMNI